MCNISIIILASEPIMFSASFLEVVYLDLDTVTSIRLVLHHVQDTSHDNPFSCLRIHRDFAIAEIQSKIEVIKLSTGSCTTLELPVCLYAGNHLKDYTKVLIIYGTRVPWILYLTISS